MVNNEHPEDMESIKQNSGQREAIQIGNILNGVEKSLAVTCESIMDKMKQLEDKIHDMEKRYSELAKDAEQTLKMSETIGAKTEETTKKDN